MTLKTRLTKMYDKPVLRIDFKASTFGLDRQTREMILNLTTERDFRRILNAEVEAHFKIAKILCNKLGWVIEFDMHKD